MIKSKSVLTEGNTRTNVKEPSTSIRPKAPPPMKQSNSTLERDKFLTEARGACWHIGMYTITQHFARDYSYMRCKKCGAFFKKEPDYSTWEGLGLLIDFIKKQGHSWQREFDYHYPISLWNITPDTVADKLYAFMKEKSK